MNTIVCLGANAPALAQSLSGHLAGVTAPDTDLLNEDNITHTLEHAEVVIYSPPIPREETTGYLLGDILRSGYNLFKSAAENTKTRRIIVISTLRFFARMPQNWRVHSHWRPRPTASPEELLPYLTECSAREITRASGRFNATGGLHLTVLRLGNDISTEQQAHAITEILARPIPEGRTCSFRIVPVGEIPNRPAATQVDFQSVLSPAAPIAARPIRRVALIGAAGPVHSATALELARDYILRLSDVHPLSIVRAEDKPQSPGAPLPLPPEALPESRFGIPHDEITADIADPDAVLAVCADCDAILNGSVVRHEPVAAFKVNAQGVYNLCCAAVHYGIKRVVQTGPLQTSGFSEDDYSWDWAIDQPPARPGRHLYGHSKYLGQEIARVFAENYGLSVPNLLYTQFVNPDAKPGWHSAMVVTWNDSARALRAALEVSEEQLGSPYEEFHISATVPQDIYRYDRARRILGWEAQDDISHLWQE